MVRVQGAGDTEQRNGAFGELLDSLAMYNGAALDAVALVMAPPSKDSLARALSVLGKRNLQKRLFEKILLTFGRTLVDPLAEILDRTPGGPLLTHMASLRLGLFQGVGALRLTQETQQILMGDLERLLNDDYLKMLAEHEEKVQQPRVKKLAQEVLQLVGATFQRAFEHWHDNAAQIAESVSRRFGANLKLGAHPALIRSRIVDALEEFLWVETSGELSGALSQLFAQRAYEGLLAKPHIAVERDVYHQFAEACWDLIAEHC
ncbi:MAG TPA: hypothetical protein VNG33_24075 [Polyangiaceae bacterium]|nr:hypothetical protein [Polyangiaceae bacterium]